RLLIDDSPDEARSVLLEAEVLLPKVLQQRKAAEEHYQLAAALALQAELASGSGREARIRDAVGELKKAFGLNFRRLHPDDVRQDRAFKVLRKRAEFGRVLAGGGANPGTR